MLAVPFVLACVYCYDIHSHSHPPGCDEDTTAREWRRPRAGACPNPSRRPTPTTSNTSWPAPRARPTTRSPRGTTLRVLVTVTTLAEYDKGTRGTSRDADRLADLVLPVLADGVASMVARGWEVDVYLICGFETLAESRR